MPLAEADPTLDQSPTSQPAASTKRAAIVALAFAVAVGLLAPIPGPLATPVFAAIQDLVHIPLFAGVYLALRWFLDKGSPTARRDVQLLVLTIGLAGGSELLQGFTSREPSWSDFVLGSVGAALACLACAPMPRWRHRAAYGIVVLVVAGAATARVMSVLRTDARLRALFPTLGAFESREELRRWRAKPGTRLRWNASVVLEGRHSIEVRATPRGDYPGVSTEFFEPDWSAYRWLTWRAQIVGAQPLDLTVRIDDDQGDSHGLRFTQVVRLTPGAHLYRIDLREAAASLRHPLNLRAIGELHFFLDQPREARTFYLDAVRLVSDAVTPSPSASPTTPRE